MLRLNASWETKLRKNQSFISLWQNFAEIVFLEKNYEKLMIIDCKIMAETDGDIKNEMNKLFNFSEIKFAIRLM